MPKQTRRVQDARLYANVALPNAANTVNTSGIDLGSSQPYPVTGDFEVVINLNGGAGANSKNINAVLQDSADNVTFANIAGLAMLTTTDNNGAGYNVATRVHVLPPATRQYIRASATGEANGGNAANSTMELILKF